MSSRLTIPQLGESQFARFAELIYSASGIRFSSQRRSVLSRQLHRRMQAKRVSCFDEYFRLIESRFDQAEWDQFIQEVTNHESYFYRDRRQWGWMREVCLPEIKRAADCGDRAKTLRVWSVACSTGEEPYTFACCAAEVFGTGNDWDIEIVATDISRLAVEKAIEGNYPERDLRNLPDTMRSRFLRPNSGLGTWRINDTLRDWIHFETHNVLHEPKHRGFDVVLVKNVLIYFDGDSKQQAMNHIMRTVNPDGLLVSGPVEALTEFLPGWAFLQGCFFRCPAIKERTV